MIAIDGSQGQGGGRVAKVIAAFTGRRVHARLQDQGYVVTMA